MADFLAKMAIASRDRTRATAYRVPMAEIRARAADHPPAPAFVLSPEGFDVIAEIKRHSPGGDAAPHIQPERRALAYADGGAAAVSVLTEPRRFDGSVEDLAAASRALERADRRIPTMRKDFIVDPYQLFEARAAGAGGALLIADLLEALDAEALLDAAAEAGVWVLVEAFADARVDLAVRLARRATARGVRALVGVNVRDLRTLAVDDGRRARVADRLPVDVPRVAESGMTTESDVAAAARLGYDLALVGRALSAAPDPRVLLAGMLRSGRAARREATSA